MGYRFSLVLNREISEEESALLREAGCASAVFGTDSLPTNAQVTVTRMDFDVVESPSLAEAIESALEAVKKVPELSVPGLEVPAQPARLPEEAAHEAGVVAGTVVADEPAPETPAEVGKPRTTRKRASGAKKKEAAAETPADAGEEQVEAVAVSK